MKRPLRLPAALLLATLGLSGSLGAVELTPALQKELARHAEVVKSWAASPVLVKAVVDQNLKGPIAGMNNEQWKAVKRSDDLVRGFIQNDAGKFLLRKVEGSDGVYLRAFLSAARGEKVAFSEKTISYLHAGQAKFDVPFSTGKTWQGPPELDVITETYNVQIAAPVLSGGKPVGVLVVGVNLSRLSKTAARP